MSATDGDKWLAETKLYNLRRGVAWRGARSQSPCDRGLAVCTPHAPAADKVRAPLLGPVGARLYVAGTRTRRLSDVHYFRGSVQPHGRTETELRGWLSRMIASCLASDTRAGRAFNAETAITTDEVLRLLRTSEKGKTRWHLTCAACSREMQLLCGGYDADKLSIDRLNNLLAHVKGNIQLLCLRCNKAKH